MGYIVRRVDQVEDSTLIIEAEDLKDYVVFDPEAGRIIYVKTREEGRALAKVMNKLSEVLEREFDDDEWDLIFEYGWWV